MSLTAHARSSSRLALLLVLTMLTGACDRSPSRALEPAVVEPALRIGDIDPFTLAAAAYTAGYKADQGTLPEVQGWTFFDYGGNPTPFVSQGALHATNTNGQQYWRQEVPNLSLTRGVLFEARIKVISSNYYPGSGPGDTGTREGYYFALADSIGGYDIGLADAGFNINGICAPNKPLTPYPFTDGNFHELRFRVRAGKATLSIDGVIVATDVVPEATAGCFGPADMVEFGGHAGISRSVTELKDFVYRAH